MPTNPLPADAVAAREALAVAFAIDDERDPDEAYPPCPALPEGGATWQLYLSSVDVVVSAGWSPPAVLREALGALERADGEFDHIVDMGYGRDATVSVWKAVTTALASLRRQLGEGGAPHA